MVYEDYVNGFIERKAGGSCEGKITIDGVFLGEIEGVYFREDGKSYLWLKRKNVLEYHPDTEKFVSRAQEPRWEAYLQKSKDGVAAYRGEFAFLHFRYSIIGVWDKVLGMEKNRLNLYVERLPMGKQDIINKISERKRNDNNG